MYHGPVAAHIADEIRALDREIAEQFRKLMALQAADPEPLPITSIERDFYSPMPRLLSRNDTIFLARRGLPAQGRRLRREHRAIYWRYLWSFAREAHRTHREYRRSVAHSGAWEELPAVARSAAQLSWRVLRLGFAGIVALLPVSLDVSKVIDGAIIAMPPASRQFERGPK